MIDIPVPGLVILVGAAGSGKSTLAARLFDPDEVLSSDAIRAALHGDPADQRATRPAFALLHREVARRLADGRLAVVDATNVERAARRALLRVARAASTPAIALVLAVPHEDAHTRNARRTGRVVPADIVDRHLGRIAELGTDAASIAARLRTEGFTAVHVMSATADLATVRVRRVVPPAGGLEGPVSPP